MTAREAWEVRNAAAETLVKTEEQLRRVLETANVEQIVALLETFSPARSPGPEWTRSFGPLIERLWTWCSDDTLAAVKASFDARGSAWSPVANALAPEQGSHIRTALRRGTGANRLPPFTLA